MSVFSDDYLKQELDFYGTAKYDKGSVMIKESTLQGRCDDYLNVNFRAGEVSVPIMYINGSIWMSITYMEVQSMFIPIAVAEGRVGLGGLGMGYAPLRIAEKEEVDSIDIYENNKDVIKFFTDKFKNRKGFKKINIIFGDMRRKLKGKTYDFFFNDIYQRLLPEEVVADAVKIKRENEIETYHFWGQEKALLSAANYELIRASYFTYREAQYFRDFIESDNSGMFRPVSDISFLKKCLKAIDRPCR